jgi:arylsulfatase
LKLANYQTFFAGKGHLGEVDNMLPNAHGFDVMKYVYLYHLNAYTYGDSTWFPDMDPEMRAIFAKVTKGAMSGNAGEKPHEEFKVNGQYVNTPDKGVVGIPFLDDYVEKAATAYLESAPKSGKPFFMDVNFVKMHQPNMPHPDYQGKSMVKTKFGDSMVELDARMRAAGKFINNWVR